MSDLNLDGLFATALSSLGYQLCMCAWCDWVACVVSWKRSLCPSVKAIRYSRSLSQVVGSDRMFSFGSFSLEGDLQSVSAVPWLWMVFHTKDCMTHPAAVHW